MEEALKDSENAVVADLDAAEVLQPSVSALDFPAAFVAAEFAPIFIAPLFVVAAVGHDQLGAALFQPLAQWVGVIAAIRGPRSRGTVGNAGVHGLCAALLRLPACFPQAGVRKSARTQVALRQVRRSRRPPPGTSYLSRDGFCRPRGPFFRSNESRIQKGFFPVQQFAVVHLAQQLPPGPQPDTLLFPHPQPPPARGTVGILIRHVSPSGPATQHPQNPL